VTSSAIKFAGGPNRTGQIFKREERKQKVFCACVKLVGNCVVTCVSKTLRPPGGHNNSTFKTKKLWKCWCPRHHAGKRYLNY
jgi:hypothetical protein